MAGQKRFGTSLFGFKKKDVNNYIEKILQEFDRRLKEKDDEADSLKAKNMELSSKYEDLAKKAKQIDDNREKIADVLIKAEEKAENMLSEAKEKAQEEKADIENQIEEEREKLIDVKRELKTLKAEVISTLKKYEGQLDNMIDDEDTSL